MSEAAILAVRFEKMCNTTKRCSERRYRTAEEPTPVMAPKLAQFPIHLRAVRKREVRNLVAEEVESVDLMGQDGCGLVVETVQEIADRLSSSGFAVVHGMENGHESNLAGVSGPARG